MELDDLIEYHTMELQEMHRRKLGWEKASPEEREKNSIQVLNNMIKLHEEAITLLKSKST